MGGGEIEVDHRVAGDLGAVEGDNAQTARARSSGQTGQIAHIEKQVCEPVGRSQLGVVDDQRNVFAELVTDFVEARFRVLYDIVQDGGADRLGIEVHLRQFLGDGNRMSNVGFAGFARLAFVCGRA